MSKKLYFQNNKVSVFGTNDEPWFLGSQFGTILEYSNTMKAIRDHVNDKYEITVADKFQGKNISFSVQPHSILINEMGVYELIFSSKMEKAQEFKDWVFGEVLPCIRKTGSYNLVHNQLVIKNEFDLHTKVV